MNAQMTEQVLRLPPHSTEAEQAVIGGLLCDSRAWDRVADVVAEADFYRDDHRRIFGRIRQLSESGKPADILTVFEAVERHNEIEQVGGLAYLGEIANNTPSVANIVRYAEIVAEKARLRALVEFSDHAGGIAFRNDSSTAQERIDELLGKLMALAEHGIAKNEPHAVSEILGRVVEQIEARMERGGEVSGLRTGLTDIDRMLDGLKGGDLVIMAGRPSMGKTALAINIAENVALAGKAVMVFSLEMGDTQLITRSLSSIGGINSTALASGSLNDEDWDRVTVAMSKLQAANLIIDESASLSAGQMRARARRQKRKTGLDLVVIDYLQLMKGDGENRHQELSGITKALKAMAKDLGVPVICLSQLSRKVEDRGDKRPMMSDLRESGAIEEDADVIAMLYRDDYYNRDSAFKGFAEVLIRKHRMGACGDIQLVFQPEFSRFRDANPQAIAEAYRIAHEQKPVRKTRGMT